MFVSQFFKKIFIVLIFTIISGCSIITAGYNRLPFLTLLELNSIFDLADEQSQKVRPILDSWLEWHRANHLPRYVVKLEEWEKLVLQDLTPAQFCKEVEVIRTFTNEAVEKFIPALWNIPDLADGSAAGYGVERITLTLLAVEKPALVGSQLAPLDMRAPCQCAVRVQEVGDLCLHVVKRRGRGGGSVQQLELLNLFARHQLKHSPHMAQPLVIAAAQFDGLGCYHPPVRWCWVTRAFHHTTQARPVPLHRTCQRAARERVHARPWSSHRALCDNGVVGPERRLRLDAGLAARSLKVPLAL